MQLGLEVYKMKLKSLLYGTAAVLVGTGASTGAMAADLPVAAEPVEYVRVCDAFGKGFFYIPGTDTCLRVGGRVRVRAFVRDNDSVFYDDGGTPKFPFDDVITTRDKNGDTYTSYARAYANFDARTETDLGLLRSYFTLRLTYGDRDIDVSDYDLTYGDDIDLDEAFISLSNDMGQLTVGKTSSFFDFYGGYTLTGNGGFDQTTDAILFGYTFNIGNGLSASLSLEDAYGGHKKLNDVADGTNNTISNFPLFNNVPLGLGQLLDPGAPFGTLYAAGVAYGGQDVPDIVANLRVDQGWGSAQIMGALRNITSKQDAGFDFGGIFSPPAVTAIDLQFDGVPVSTFDDEWGWAVGAGLEINIPGMPVSFAMQGGYSEGAISYVASPAGPAEDALAVVSLIGGGATTLELTEGWQIGAGVNIDATSTVSVAIDGAYGDIDHYGSLFDYDYWGAAGAVTWKPVSGLAIAAEIQYSEINSNAAAIGGPFSAGTCASNDAGGVPSQFNFGGCPILDDDSWQFTLSFQRDF